MRSLKPSLTLPRMFSTGTLTSSNYERQSQRWVRRPIPATYRDKSGTARPSTLQLHLGRLDNTHLGRLVCRRALDKQHRHTRCARASSPDCGDEVLSSGSVPHLRLVLFANQLTFAQMALVIHCKYTKIVSFGSRQTTSLTDLFGSIDDIVLAIVGEPSRSCDVGRVRSSFRLGDSQAAPVVARNNVGDDPLLNRFRCTVENGTKTSSGCDDMEWRRKNGPQSDDHTSEKTVDDTTRAHFHVLVTRNDLVEIVNFVILETSRAGEVRRQVLVDPRGVFQSKQAEVTVALVNLRGHSQVFFPGLHIRRDLAFHEITAKAGEPEVRFLVVCDPIGQIPKKPSRRAPTHKESTSPAATWGPRRESSNPYSRLHHGKEHFRPWTGRHPFWLRQRATRKQLRRFSVADQICPTLVQPKRQGGPGSFRVSSDKVHRQPKREAGSGTIHRRVVCPGETHIVELGKLCGTIGNRRACVSDPGCVTPRSDA